MAAVPLAIALAPLIPVMIDTVLRVVEAIRTDPVMPEEQKAKLAALATDLEAMKARVAAVELPTPGSGA